MAVPTKPQTGSSGSFFTFLEAHPTVAVGAVLGILIVGGMLISKKQQASTTPNADTSGLPGLTNGNIVYVPTSTNFTTVNRGSNFGNTTNNVSKASDGGIIQNAVGTPSSNTGTSSNTTTSPQGTIQQAVQRITQQTVSSGSTTQTNSSVQTNVNTVPGKAPPPPQPKPPQTSKGLIWDQRHTITGGETLSGIAASLTRSLRAAGMPGSMSVGWPDLYAHNTAVINATAAAHHNPIPGGPWNDIFPGEVITVPRWG